MHVGRIDQGSKVFLADQYGNNGPHRPDADLQTTPTSGFSILISLKVPDFVAHLQGMHRGLDAYGKL